MLDYGTLLQISPGTLQYKMFALNFLLKCQKQPAPRVLDKGYWASRMLEV